MDALKESEERVGELLREAGKTLIALAEHVEEQGFEYDYVVRAFLRCSEGLAEVREAGMLIIEMREQRTGKRFDEGLRFEDYLS